MILIMAVNKIKGDKPLNEAELLCIIRLSKKGCHVFDIAERIGITYEQARRELLKINLRKHL